MTYDVQLEARCYCNCPNAVEQLIQNDADEVVVDFGVSIKGLQAELALLI